MSCFGVRVKVLSFLPALAFAIALPAFAASASGMEGSVAEFYSGKMIRIIVGYTPGGAFDTYSRLVARNMSRYVPGKPKFIVQNKPGAGGLVAATSVYAVEPKDGTAIVSTNQGLVLQRAIGRKGVDIDMGKFNWLGSSSKPLGACVIRRDLGISGIEEIIAGKAVTTGAGGAGSQGHDIPAVFNAALGTKFKIVTGYPGISGVQAALLRKEVDAFCPADPLAGVLHATLGGDDPVAKVVVTLRDNTSDAPILKGIPSAMGLARSEEAKLLLRTAMGPLQMAFPWAVAPEVPPARVEALRQGLAKTFADPRFLAEARKAKMGIDFSDGAEVTRTVDGILNAPAEIRAKLKKVLEK